MDFGLYEKLLDKELKNQILDLHNETRKVDKSESVRVLATAYYKILRKILSEKKDEDRKYVFFDLRPYSHQKEILEDLRVEREEYESYKNLVVAATGERVIIVTGCINALRSRVSGILVNIIHALLRVIRV